MPNFSAGTTPLFSRRRYSNFNISLPKCQLSLIFVLVSARIWSVRLLTAMSGSLKSSGVAVYIYLRRLSPDMDSGRCRRRNMTTLARITARHQRAGDRDSLTSANAGVTAAKTIILSPPVCSMIIAAGSCTNKHMCFPLSFSNPQLCVLFKHAQKHTKK
jgi:hypothetical protein